MSEPEFQKGGMVWVVKGSSICSNPQLVGALGTIEDYIGTRPSDELHFYLLTIDGTTYSVNEDWLEYV